MHYSDSFFKLFIKAFFIFQLDVLEERLKNIDEKSMLRKSLSAMSPSKKVDPLHAARVICRLVIPDRLLQFFTIQRISKDKRKKLLPIVYPTIYATLVGQLIKKSGKDLNVAVAGLSRHIAKCSDRKISRCQRVFDSIPDPDADTCSVSSRCSSDETSSTAD